MATNPASGQVPDQLKEEPPKLDDKAAFEQLTLEEQEQAARIALVIQYRVLRGKYARAVFWLMCCWMGAVILLLAASGSSWFKFELSDTVLTTLVAGTTGNIIGLFGIVMWSLFPRSKDPMSN